MGDATITLKSGEKFTVRNVPEGATNEQIISWAEQNHQQADQTTRTERFGMGLGDPFVGAAQVGARMDENAGMGGIPSFVLNPQAHQQRIETVDKFAREREEAYEKRRGPDAGIDWMRGFGSIPGTLALTSPLALTGPASPFVMGGGGGMLQPAKNFEEEKLGQVGMGTAVGGVLGMLGKLAAGGVRSLGAFLAREYPENAAVQAVQRLAQRYRQDRAGGGPSLNEIIEEVNQAHAEGKPAMFVDYAGENVRGSAGTLLREQGRAKSIGRTALNERQAGAGERIDADLGRFVHDDQSMLQTSRAVRATRAGEAAEPYERGLDPTRVVDSPYIRQVLADPDVRALIKEGVASQRREALGDRLPFTGTDAAQYLVMDEAGNVTGVKGVPNMGVLDAVKRGLDHIIQSERNELTGQMSPRGVQFDKIRRQFLAEVDARNPDYAQARAIWSGHSATLDAMNAGRAALRAGKEGMSPEEIAEHFHGLTPGDQEFFRLGVATYLREQLFRAMAPEGMDGTTQRNLAMRLLSSEWTRRQLGQIFRTPEEFDGFMRAISFENRAFGTRADLIKGSATAERRAEDTSAARDVAEQAVEIGHSMGSVAHGNPIPLIKQAWNAWRQRAAARGVTANEEANAAMAEILFGGRISPERAQLLRDAVEGRGPGYAGLGAPGVNPAGRLAAGLSMGAEALAAGGGSFGAHPLGF